MTKNIVAIVGMPGAGKSEAAKFFKDKGFPILRFGDITDAGLIEAGKELTEENERLYREKLRRELGMEAYAIKIKPRIDEVLSSNDTVVLDGLYSWEEYTYLKQHYSNLTILCIYAQPSIRYRRLVQRNHRRRDYDEARERDLAELVNLNKGGPIAIADYLIKNEGTLENFTNELEKFLSTNYFQV